MAARDRASRQGAASLPGQRSARRVTFARLLGLPIALVTGCVAIADIGDVEFGTPTGTGASGAAGLTGGGGSGANGLTGGGGSGANGLTGGGGAGGTATCDDEIFNGQETGIDCGGPDCPPCSEDCTNGEDDDGNTLVDCADPLCSDYGYGCAPPAPDDWSGPIAFYAGLPTDPLPACPAGWPDRATGGSGDLTAPAATCGACTCGAPSGATCDPPTLTFWSTTDCSGSAVLTHEVPVLPTQCDGFGGTNRNSVIVSLPSVSGGTCAASGGAADVTPASWASANVACDGATFGGGCGSSGDVCVREPPAPFGASWCVVRAGDVACPAEDYTERTLVYTSIDDDRDCTSCSCEDPTGGSCELEVTLYTNIACGTDATIVPADGTTCAASLGMKGVRYSVASGPSGGSCTPTGGAPTGAAVPGGATTVCCMP